MNHLLGSGPGPVDAGGDSRREFVLLDDGDWAGPDCGNPEREVLTAVLEPVAIRVAHLPAHPAMELPLHEVGE